MEPTAEEIVLENELNPGQAKPAEDQTLIEKSAEGKGTPDEQEFDLGFAEDGKTPLKLKRSQIMELRKGGMLEKDYTHGKQELAAQREQLKEVVDIIDYLKKNPAKAEKIVAILDAKEEELEKQEDKLQDKQEDIDALLKELPQDDPYARVLRAQKAELQKALKLNQSLQSRLDQIDQRSLSENRSKFDTEAEQTLTEVIATERKTLEFLDDEDAEYWKKSVLTYLVNSPQEYEQMDKEKFAEYFKGISQHVYSEMNKLGDKRVKKYIDSKGTGKIPGVGAVGVGKPLSAKPTMDNLESILKEELEKEI